MNIIIAIINLPDIASKWEVESFKWRSFTHSSEKSGLQISKTNESMGFCTKVRLKAWLGEAYFLSILAKFIKDKKIMANTGIADLE